MVPKLLINDGKKIIDAAVKAAGDSLADLSPQKKITKKRKKYIREVIFRAYKNSFPEN